MQIVCPHEEELLYTPNERIYHQALWGTVSTVATVARTPHHCGCTLHCGPPADNTVAQSPTTLWHAAGLTAPLPSWPQPQPQPHGRRTCATASANCSHSQPPHCGRAVCAASGDGVSLCINEVRYCGPKRRLTRR